MNTEQQQYIEHEVKLRLLDEKFILLQTANNEKFASLEKRMESGFAVLKKDIDVKMGWVIGICVSGFLIPTVLKILGVF